MIAALSAELAPLSARLAAVAELVPDGLPMADIGTDHARLPTWLVASGRVPRALAIDDKPDPLALARRTVAEAGLEHRVACVLADGCAGLDETVRTVTICGMGGAATARILARVSDTVTRVVLNPNTEPARVRGALAATGWRVDAERVLFGGRWFTIFAASRGTWAPDPVALAWGEASAHRDVRALATCLDDAVAHLSRLPRRRDVPERLAVAVEARRRLGRAPA